VSANARAALDAALAALLPQPRETLGLAVSGGGDSMALMVLLADWAEGRGMALAAVTVDHGLRPEAAAEAAAVARQAAGLGISHDILRWQGPAGAPGNLQDMARRARYRLIADWAAGAGIGHVALGHTRDDLAETLLMRLARGSGVDGLAAMAPLRRMHGVAFLRPLLDVSRAALRAELRRRGLAWVEDPSNNDPRFERVKARRVLAALAPLGITAERLARTAQHLATARAALRGATAEAAQRLARVDAGGAVWLDPAGLAELPEEIRLRLLAHALCWVSTAEYRPRRDALERLAAGLAAGRGGTLHGCRAVRRRAGIGLLREPRAAEAAAPAAPDALWDGRWRFVGEAPAGAVVRALGAAGLAILPDTRRAGLPRDVLRASPALWLGERLLAAPLVTEAEGPCAMLDPPGGSFAQAAIAH